MEGNTKTQADYALLLKSIDDPRLRYLTAKKLAEMWPETHFSEWKSKLEKGSPMILQRAGKRAVLLNLKTQLEQISAPVEIVEQKSIGGKPIF